MTSSRRAAPSGASPLTRPARTALAQCPWALLQVGSGTWADQRRACSVSAYASSSVILASGGSAGAGFGTFCALGRVMDQ